MRKIIRRKATANKIGISLSSLWRYEQDPNFPKKVVLGPNANGFFDDEVDDWLVAQQNAGE